MPINNVSETDTFVKYKNGISNWILPSRLVVYIILIQGYKGIRSSDEYCVVPDDGLVSRN